MALGRRAKALIPVCIEANAVPIRVSRTGAAGTPHGIAFASVCAIRVAGRIEWAPSAHAIEADKTVATPIAAAATVLFIRGCIETSAVAKDITFRSAGWGWCYRAGQSYI